MRILIVCTGNTCRSPMAEGLLLSKIRRDGQQEQVQVLSAGLAGEGGLPASYGAQVAMGERGVDISGHASRQLYEEYVEAADLILVMTRGHKQWISERWPLLVEGKLYTISEFVGEKGEVADPFGGDNKDYKACCEQLDALLEKAWQKIRIRQESFPEK